MFPSDDKSREWLEQQIWPDGPNCPYCGSFNVQCNIKHNTMTHRCRDCPNRPQFSLKTGTIMQASNLSYRDWAIAIYLLTTNLKGVSAMKLHRELEIAYTSAWHLAHRLRAAFNAGKVPTFTGPVEVDEAYIGGKRNNMLKSKRERMTGRSAAGKTAVVGAKDRETNKVIAGPVETTDKATLQRFVEGVKTADAKVYTDGAASYVDIERDHESVNCCVGEYIREMAHTTGGDSFWAMLKRGYQGAYRKMSPKHLHRYVDEFSGRTTSARQTPKTKWGTLCGA